MALEPEEPSFVDCPRQDTVEEFPYPNYPRQNAVELVLLALMLAIAAMCFYMALYSS